MAIKLDYKPDGAVLRQFMKSDMFFRGIRGPVGSGKSVGCCIEILRRALQQEPNDQGLRKSRWAVVRNTNPQLRTTTIKTWLDWMREDDFGHFTWSVPYTHRIMVGDIDLEVIFLALDRPEDVRKLLSLELTGVWINEAREVPKSIVDACTMRVGRFPSMREGGPSWYGVICDTNAPEDDHWWPIMAGESPIPDHISHDESLMLIKPDNWEFFCQPPGMIEQKDEHGLVCAYDDNGEAENAKNLTPNYYNNIIRGKSKSWIDVYVLNRLGVVEEGRPVYPMFRDTTHIAKEPLIPIEGAPIYVGVDFGLTPAATFGQRSARAQWLILGELVCTDMGVIRFSELLRNYLEAHYASHEAIITGDPAGDYRAQTDETTPFQIMKASGLKARPARSNDPALRIEAVENALNRMVDGMPGVLIDPSCKVLIKGFQGGYGYRRLSVSGGEKYSDRPDKDRYSHVHDACQYMFIGAGEGKAVLGRNQGEAKAMRARSGWNPFVRDGREPRRKSVWNFR